jgi:hypothetical protein
MDGYGYGNVDSRLGLESHSSPCFAGLGLESSGLELGLAASGLGLGLEG